MNNNNIKTTGTWDGEFIWREKTAEERYSEMDDHYAFHKTNSDPNTTVIEYSDPKKDEELGNLLSNEN